MLERSNKNKIIILIFLAILSQSVFALNITVLKTVPEKINLGEILQVNITVFNLEDSYVNVTVKEYISISAEPVDPANFTYETSSELEFAVSPPYYSWNATLAPNSKHEIIYKIKPLSFGNLFLSPTEVTTSSGEVFRSEPVGVSVERPKNGICEPDEGENYYTNPEDCPSGSEDGVCDLIEDGRCDPDCAPEADSDCVQPRAPWLYAALIILVVAIIVYYIWRRRNEEKKIDELVSRLR